jgi:hypothetical protein
MAKPSPVRCRQITEADFEAVSALLERGFPARPRQYWTDALQMLRRREAPAGCARFGYLLEADGVPVGLHLLIFNTTAERPGADLRCQASAWYVEPQYRSYATLLISVATRDKSVTYLNSTASAHTWPVLEAMGYRRYSQGQFVAFPALSAGRGVKVSSLSQSAEHRGLDEHGLLRAHAQAGCLALVCETPDGPKPFVFLRRKVRYAPIGVVQLVYCREMADLTQCAGALGRFLLRRGVSCLICDADGPVPGLAGFFVRDKNPRFFKGPHPPRLNDLAFSEMVLLESAARSGRGGAA